MQMKFLSLMPCDLSQSVKACHQFDYYHHNHYNIGSPLQGQNDQVFIEKEESLQRQLQQDC